MATQKCLRQEGIFGGGIYDYSESAQFYKELFQREARALFKQAGQFLAQSGWAECDTRVNPAGMAGPGNLRAGFWNPDSQFHTVYRTTVPSSVSFGGRKEEGPA